MKSFPSKSRLQPIRFATPTVFPLPLRFLVQAENPSNSQSLPMNQSASGILSHKDSRAISYCLAAESLPVNTIWWKLCSQTLAQNSCLPGSGSSQASLSSLDALTRNRRATDGHTSSGCRAILSLQWSLSSFLAPYFCELWPVHHSRQFQPPKRNSQARYAPRRG